MPWQLVPSLQCAGQGRDWATEFTPRCSLDNRINAFESLIMCENVCKCASADAGNLLAVFSTCNSPLLQHDTILDGRSCCAPCFLQPGPWESPVGSSPFAQCPVYDTHAPTFPPMVCQLSGNREQSQGSSAQCSVLSSLFEAMTNNNVGS